jgi:hypothetical protein
MATAGANIATSIMAMEATTTVAAAIMPSTGIMLTATTIATAGRTAAKCIMEKSMEDQRTAAKCIMTRRIMTHRITTRLTMMRRTMTHRTMMHRTMTSTTSNL